MRLHRGCLLALAAASLGILPAVATAELLEITQVGPTGVFLDFDTGVVGSNNGSFQGLGFSPTPGAGQLDSASWAAVLSASERVNFGGTGTIGRVARGPHSTPEGGAPQNGGVSAFDVNNGPGQTNWGLGVKPSNNAFGPGEVYLRVVNSTGLTTTEWGVEFDLYNRNNTSRSGSVTLAYAVAPTSIVDPRSLSYSSTGLTYTSPTTATTTTAWTLAGDFSTLSSLDVSDGDALYLRWLFADVTPTGSNLRDGFVLDNIRVSIPAAVPEPSSLLLTGLAAACGVPILLRRRQVTRGDA